MDALDLTDKITELAEFKDNPHFNDFSVSDFVQSQSSNPLPPPPPSSLVPTFSQPLENHIGDLNKTIVDGSYPLFNQDHVKVKVSPDLDRLRREGQILDDIARSIREPLGP